MPPSGIRNHGASSRGAADLRLRQQGHRDEHSYQYEYINCSIKDGAKRSITLLVVDCLTIQIFCLSLQNVFRMILAINSDSFPKLH